MITKDIPLECTNVPLSERGLAPHHVTNQLAHITKSRDESLFGIQKFGNAVRGILGEIDGALKAGKPVSAELVKKFKLASDELGTELSSLTGCWGVGDPGEAADGKYAKELVDEFIKERLEAPEAYELSVVDLRILQGTEKQRALFHTKEYNTVTERNSISFEVPVGIEESEKLWEALSEVFNENMAYNFAQDADIEHHDCHDSERELEIE